MIAVGKIGKGVSGCLRYVLGQGRDPDTHQTRPAAVGDDASRVAWISGQGFEGWTPRDRAAAELARKVMEFAALNQTSTTRRCEKDCLHLVLSWRDGENPSQGEMKHAAREALAAIGMKKARAVFVAHNDTDHAHLHVVASRINPNTGKAFRDSYLFVKIQTWALQWEQRHGHIQCPARGKRSAATTPPKHPVDLVGRRRAGNHARKFAGKPLMGTRAAGASSVPPEAKAALWGSVARQATRSVSPSLVRPAWRSAVSVAARNHKRPDAQSRPVFDAD